MPRFLGLFSRKAKHTTDTTSSNGSVDHDSSVSGSPTTSGSLGWDKFVSSSSPRSALHPGTARSFPSHLSPTHGERSNVYPSSPSASSTASTSKLRLPFGRKRQQSPPPSSRSITSVNATETSPVQHRPFHTAPGPSLDRERDSFVSDGAVSGLRRLRPPPSKSAIFAAYADPQSALSTRSLPNEASQPLSLQGSVQPPPLPDSYEQSSEESMTKSAPNSAKKSFFSWTKSNIPIQVAKSRSKSTPPSQIIQELKLDPLPDLSNSSFNLKSFRHVGPSSSLDIEVPTPVLDVPSPSPSPRPRGPSMGESSQRISVGAFREAQARRSMAGSPIPPPRPSSPFGVPQEPGGANGRASPRLGPGRSSFLFDTKSDDHSLPQTKNSALASDTDADTSSAGEDSDDDSDRERTVTQRSAWTGKMKAKSELGHMSSRNERAETRAEAQSRPRSSFGYYNEPRRRASASTSAATPSAAAKRASIIANNNSNDPIAEYKRTSRHIRETAVCSNSGTGPPSAFSMKQPTRPTSPASNSSDDDDDDAPLATLVPPRRPGSAMSLASGSSHPSVQNSSRSTSHLPRTKPLIDINEVVGNKPPPSLPVRVGRNEALSEDKGFTKGNTLLSATTSTNVSSPNSRIPAPIKTSFRLSAGPLTTSPTESVNSSSFATAPSSAKPTASSSFPFPSNDDQATLKRDGLNERLARVAKSASSTANSSSPSSTPPRTNTQSNTDAAKKVAFPRALSSQQSFERTRSASPAPAATTSRLSTDLSRLTPSKVTPLKLLDEPSPPDEELAKMLGAGIQLISRTGESSPEFDTHQRGSESEDSSDSSDDEDKQESGSGEEKVDDWENVDPKEAKGREEYKIKDSLLKSKGVLGGRGKEKGKEKNKKVQELAPKVTEPPIAPIPIKQRQPTPSFSVMSRPPLVRNGVAASTSGTGSGSGSGPGSSPTSARLSSTSNGSLDSSNSNDKNNNRTRPRSSTLLNPALPDSRASQSSPNASPAVKSSDATRSRGAALLSAPPIRSTANSRSSVVSGASVQDKPSNPGTNRSSLAMDSPSSSTGRPRSSTMLPVISVSSVSPVMPVPPFARRESPASSTGDSSNGRAPLTPRDGSDIGSAGGSSSAMKGMGGMKNWKRRSVCFEDELRDGDTPSSSSSGKGKTMHKQTNERTEEKRKERRRSEAKAAIELGNVINGRGPIVDDDEEEDMPINQTTHARMSSLNPMMAMGSGMHPAQMGSMPSWNGSWGGPMGQQSMMNGPPFMFPPAADPSLFAAHQQAMMVAKQAYQLAVAQQAAVAAGDEWERGSVTSGFSGFGRGMPSPYMTSPYGMGMNMMPMGNNWPPGGSGIYPSGARSVFGISASRSEYGGATAGGGGWGSSRSTYGEAFGPPTGRIPGMTERERRQSGHFPPVPPIPAQTQTGSRMMGSPRVRTTSQPAASRTRNPPPSSWKG